MMDLVWAKQKNLWSVGTKNALKIHSRRFLHRAERNSKSDPETVSAVLVLLILLVLIVLVVLLVLLVLIVLVILLVLLILVAVHEITSLR